MLNLPLALRLEKNKLNASLPWLTLIDLTTPAGSHIRLARNNEDVEFGGNTYTARAFEVGETRVAGDGRVAGVGVRIANPNRAFNQAMRDNGGLVGSSIDLIVVHAGNLAADHAELTLNYTVLTASADDDWLTFALGADNPLRRRFPLYQILPDTCPWVFRGAECAYAGTATSCNRTLPNCRALGNSARFGGRPGVRGAPRFVS